MQQQAAPGSSSGFEPPFTVRPKALILPPRLFDSPTGDIIPSLVVHAGGGLSFGFSDDERNERWVVSLGLGGVGEAVVSSSRIVHIIDPESEALIGFRIRVPVAWASRELEERLNVAFNVAATDDNQFSTNRPFTSEDGIPVDQLTYEHRETTAGLAATLALRRTRLHAVVHATDMRIDGVRFSSPSGEFATGLPNKLVHTSFGLGMDFAANPKTFFLTEVRSSPLITFGASTGKVDVESLLEFTMGLRFFPDPVVALDANVGIDDEAVGLADLEIGFGLHLVLQPSLRERM
ncbi:MAG: hypothetical protein ACE5G2_03370 [Candidatus Krumholzibacteriia bacterium]